MRYHHDAKRARARLDRFDPGMCCAGRPDRVLRPRRRQTAARHPRHCRRLGWSLGLATPSKREKQVSELLAAGRSPQQAADELGIGLATVSIHRHKAALRREGSRPLSKRQREVVSCVALGLTIEEVAEHLGISRGTAVNHRTLAGLTIGARSAVALTHYAIVQGWIDAGDALSPERIDAALQRITRDAARS